MKTGLLKRTAILTLTLIAFCSGIKGQIRFVGNEGQWEPNVAFRAEIPGGYLFVGKNSLTYLFYDQQALHQAMHDKKTVAVDFHAVKMRLIGANEEATATGYLPGQTVYNYFKGNDPSKWAAGLKGYKRLVLHNVYPGIDLELLAGDETIKYNFLVQPGADPDVIQMQYEGADNVVAGDHGLSVETSLGNMTEEPPYVFQPDRDVKSQFVLKNDKISFKLGRYKKNLPLTIDPQIIFSTFSGSVADNFGFTATYDQFGNAYAGGTVYAPNFPTTTGAFQEKFQGGANGPSTGTPRDAGILKFSPNGKQLLYATYVGGSNNEQPHSMVVNSAGELVVFGTTHSSNFPVTASGFDATYNGGGDMYVVRLSSDGTQLLSGTFIGGSQRDGLNGISTSKYDGLNGPLAYNYGDEYRGEVIVDKNDNVYVASSTRSSPAHGFPAVNGFGLNFGNGAQSGVVMKFDASLSALLWSSYIQGNSQDAAYGIALSNDESEIYVCGGTQSQDFPTTASSDKPEFQGGIDGFLCRISADGKQLLGSTFVGTNQYDQVYFVQVDGAGKVYVTGQTKGSFPVKGSVYSETDGKQFIAVYNSALSNMEMSTVFGSGRPVPDLSPSAFLVDICGRVYFSGWGGATNNLYNSEGFSTGGLTTSNDAAQKTSDGSDFYLIVFSDDLKGIEYASYFGGSQSHEHVDGGTSRFDKNGIVYQSVCAGCGGFSDFPTTDGAWSDKNKGRRPVWPYEGGCNNAIFKIDLNSSNFAPVFPDTVITVTATDNINFNFLIKDSDKEDSVYFNFNGTIFNPGKTDPPLATITGKPGIGQASGTFSWQTACEHSGQDTLVVTINMWDNGCPTPRTSTGTIKIVIEDPPIPVKPEIFCLRRLDPNTLELNLDGTVFDEWTSHYELVKRLPDGTEKVLTEFTEGDKTFLDVQAFNHATTDYCYYIYGVNICGNHGDSTRMECSIPELDSLPPAAYLYTATVEANEFVRVIWGQYTDEDFFEYRLFRKENIPGAEYKSIKAFKDSQDTTYLDEDVNVHEKSYCYKLVVIDQCGLQSSDDNYGCTILLTGESIPFEHHLDWNAYEEWEYGVREYRLFRRDPYSPDSLILITDPGTLSTVDDNLDYDVGLYWYRVVAWENDSSRAISSVSNEIELIQSPLLHVPNVFTPNADSINETFNYMPVFVKDFNVKVFNRWGEKVYEGNDRHLTWNGVYRGHEPFDNVFVYLITFTGWDGTTHHRKGNVTLLR